MVDQEHLEALDSMLWVSSSHRAASIVYTNQSTVIRRAREVLSIFGGAIERSPTGWRLRGTDEMLQKERWIHQHFRFAGRRPLRLHVPCWSFTVPGLPLPNDSWICNPSSGSYACENPLELLTERIIDASLLTPTQVEQISPEQAAQLVLLPIYHSSIDLLASPCPEAAAPAPPVKSPALPARSRSPRFQLHLLPFLPQSCRLRSRECFQQMPEEGLEPLVAAGGADPDGLYRIMFLTPEMQRLIPWPCVVDRSLDCPYTETLAFLAEHADEPSMIQLIDLLSDHFSAQLPCASQGSTPQAPHLAVID